MNKRMLALLALVLLGGCTSLDRSLNPRSTGPGPVPSLIGKRPSQIARPVLAPPGLLVPSFVPPGLHLEMATGTALAPHHLVDLDYYNTRFTVYESPPGTKPPRRIALTSAGQGDSATYPFIYHQKGRFQQLNLRGKQDAAIGEYPHNRRIVTWPLGKKCCGQAMLLADGLTRQEIVSVANRAVERASSEFDRLTDLPLGLRPVVSGPVAAAVLSPMNDPIIGSDVILRYTNRSSKSSIQVVLAAADDKLSKVMNFLVAGSPATIRGQAGVAGELSSADIFDHGELLAKSWTENGILAVAFSERVSLSDFDQFIESLHPSDLKELPRLAGKVKNHPVENLFPNPGGDRRRVLATGSVQVDTPVALWAIWVYDDKKAIVPSVHFSDGRRCPTFDSELAGRPAASISFLQEFIEGGYANLCDPAQAGPAFAHGVVPPHVTKLELHLRSGEVITANLSAVEQGKDFRSFAEMLPGREPGKVVGISEVRKYDASGSCTRRTLLPEEEPCPA